MSWIPLANRRQANVDSSGNPLPLSGSLSETGLGKTADVTDYPLTLEDITKGESKLILFMIAVVIKYHLIHQH